MRQHTLQRIHKNSGVALPVAGTAYPSITLLNRAAAWKTVAAREEKGRIVSTNLGAESFWGDAA